MSEMLIDILLAFLTVSPGKDLADAFGHSGIRVIDRELNYDLVFNFGIYDFQAPLLFEFCQRQTNLLL